MYLRKAIAASKMKPYVALVTKNSMNSVLGVLGVLDNVF